jgi:transposase
MRRPSSLRPWFTVVQLVAWVKESPDKAAYQRRLAIWLTYAGPFAAHRVAELLAVSTQAVWKWVGEYNAHGPSGLERKGRGGRRWGLMTLDQERAFLDRHLAKAESGHLPTARQLSSALSKKLSQEVSIDYIYALLRRHQGHKLTPRPHHAGQDQGPAEAFKKKSRRLSKP